MTYYLNPFMLILAQDSHFYYRFENTLFQISPKEFELLQDFEKNKTQFSPSRLRLFLETKLLIDTNYDIYVNETSYVNRGWFELSDFSSDDFANIMNSQILILGCGGTGTHVVWNLAALGIKKFILIDDDVVEFNNFNRQLFYDSRDIGKFKVDVLKNKLYEIYPDIEITAYQKRIKDGHDLATIVDLSKVDVVVKGIDSPSDHLYQFGEFFYEKRISFVCGGTVGTDLFLGPTHAPFLANQYRNTSEYLSNAKMGKIQRVAGKAVSLPLIFSYIGSELTKEIIFLLTNKKNKILYNNRIQIRNIFDNGSSKHNYLYLFLKIIAVFMVILSINRADWLLIVLAILSLFMVQLAYNESEKHSFLSFLAIAFILGVVGLFRQTIAFDNPIQAMVVIVFTLLTYLCYFSISMMLLKFSLKTVLVKYLEGK